MNDEPDTSQIITLQHQPPKTGISLSYMQTLALSAYKSGMFKKFQSPEAAFMVLQFGFDLGLSPTMALTSIHFYDGRPSMSGNLMWSIVKAHPSWSRSKIVERTDKGCKIEWVQDGQTEGLSWFNEEDAKRAGLISKNQSIYGKYPRAMYFNRAVSEGFKLYCPHLGNGYTIYTPDELGQQIDENGEAVVLSASSDPFPPASEAQKESREQEVRALLSSVNLTVEQAAEILAVNPDYLLDPVDAEFSQLQNLVETRKQIQEP